MLSRAYHHRIFGLMSGYKTTTAWLTQLGWHYYLYIRRVQRWVSTGDNARNVSILLLVSGEMSQFLIWFSRLYPAEEDETFLLSLGQRSVNHLQIGSEDEWHTTVIGHKKESFQWPTENCKKMLLKSCSCLSWSLLNSLYSQQGKEIYANFLWVCHPFQLQINNINNKLMIFLSGSGGQTGDWIVVVVTIVTPW